MTRLYRQGRCQARFITELALLEIGVVLCNQIRTVDLEARGAKRVESVPEVVMDDVLARIQVLIE
ncbi:type II toxin-antitoxin system PemK/MazF family toxin [Xanthomonas arboricola]|nr:type II toxin-antitoxin system PemK/MazF family toxin [Xanthomonas arboricola]